MTSTQYTYLHLLTYRQNIINNYKKEKQIVLSDNTTYDYDDNSSSNEEDDDDDDDEEWLDAETNLPLTNKTMTTTTTTTTKSIANTAATTINNKYSLLVQKMNEFKKLLDTKYSGNVQNWIKKLIDILKAVESSKERHFEVKMIRDKLINIRNKIDILNDKYSQFKHVRV